MKSAFYSMHAAMFLRVLLLAHRYLGIVVGLLMALWCLSGFVMLYAGYPRLGEVDRVRGMAPLNLDAPVALKLDPALPVGAFRVEMLAGHAVLRLEEEPGQPALRLDGAASRDIDADAALMVARDFASGHALQAAPSLAGSSGRDQWTMEAPLSALPMFVVRLNDDAYTELYVSSRSGEVLQRTTRRSRVLGYLGAVPHWLYPSMLRRHGAVWYRVVVWASLFGVFLTATGLYVGVSRLRRRASGGWSPYRGWQFWHHIAGLCFGVLTLTWVGSGLLTMNPWGLLESAVGERESAAVSGSVESARVERFLHRLPSLPFQDARQVRSAVLDDQLFAMVTALPAPAAGSESALPVTTRVDENGAPSPLAADALAHALERLETPVRSFARIDAPDTYYYDRHDRAAVLPAWRAVLGDADGTTLYFDAGSGQLLAAHDRVARQSRWWRTGLHDFDFSAWLRRRPVRDIVVPALLAGVSAVCLTGAWLAVGRVRQDLARLRRHRLIRIRHWRGQ